MNENAPELEEKLEKLEKDFKIVTFTGRSCLVTSVKRMKAEKEMNIPISLRTGCPLSLKYGRPANELTEQEWEDYYGIMCEELKKLYPENYAYVFPSAL
jgi:hypothetical protein